MFIDHKIQSLEGLEGPFKLGRSMFIEILFPKQGAHRDSSVRLGRYSVLS